MERVVVQGVEGFSCGDLGWWGIESQAAADKSKRLLALFLALLLVSASFS